MRTVAFVIVVVACGSWLAACSSNGSPSSSPSQQFVHDIQQNLQPAASALSSGEVTTGQLVTGGDRVCNGMSAGVQSGEVTQLAYQNAYLNEPPNLSFPKSQTLHDAEVFEEYAFKDLCPKFVSDIPLGDPGSTS